MQLNSSYLYPNRIELYQNLNSWVTERYHQVYQRKFNLYRGVDNRLDLHIKNSDQKGKNITGLTIVFNIIAPESGELVKQKDCTVYDVTSGRVFVEFNEQDIYDLNPGLYNFSAHAVDTSGIKHPLYGDSHHSAVGSIEVFGNAYAEAKESQVIDTFLETGANTGIFVSEVVDGKPQFNSNSGIHTFALYMTNYSGDVTVQGSLENSTSPSNWIDISTETYTNSGLTYLNVTGVWSVLRIKHQLASGTIDKILYRY